MDADQLHRATRSMAHRGPDGEGFYLRGRVGFGHRRLSIIDLAGGAQPLSNEDGTVWVTFNGEIYNHSELRRELQARGHRFATRSDTEVLVHGYEEWGDALPTRLRGMFAFAIWDERTQGLLLVRDRVGIKPLYWARVGEDLVFASEVKALFCFPDVRREEDEARLPEFLALRYVPGPKTMFSGIERLPPGHRLTFRGGRVVIAPFWDVPVHASLHASVGTEEQEAQRLTELFEETTRFHLIGEVPVGLFLSGGIDSTAAAWAMKEANPTALKTFSVGFEGDVEEELGFARLAAEAIGTQHREVFVSSALFRDSLEELAWHLDEPLADGACIPLMHLARRAREEVVIVLSGEGADEILGGYGIYPKLLSIERARRMMGPVARPLSRLGLRAVAHPKARKYLGMMGRSLEQSYFGVGRAFNDELLVQTFGPGALAGLVNRFAPHWEATRDAPGLHRMLYTDTKVWLPDDLLIKADKMTMAASVELRVPFLDHAMIERAWGLPLGMKLKGATGKYLLRKAMKGRIPDAILTRKKKGFPVPIGRWLRTSLYGACRERLLATQSGARAQLGVKLLERLLEEHRSGQVDRTEELYALWVYEEWRQAFFHRRSTAPERNIPLLRGPEPLFPEPSPGMGKPARPALGPELGAAALPPFGD